MVEIISTLITFILILIILYIIQVIYVLVELVDGYYDTKKEFFKELSPLFYIKYFIEEIKEAYKKLRD